MIGRGQPWPCLIHRPDMLVKSEAMGTKRLGSPSKTRGPENWKDVPVEGCPLVWLGYDAWACLGNKLETPLHTLRIGSLGGCW